VTVAMATTEEDAATAQNLIIWADVAPTSFVSLTPATPVNPSGWTLLSWTATVSWTGTLSSATLYVETSTGTDSFFLDDASLQ
jgi:hypothetical protein